MGAQDPPREPEIGVPARRPHTPQEIIPRGDGWLERLGFGKPRVIRDTVTRPVRQPVRCAGQPISDVVILTQPPYRNSLLGRFARIERIVSKAHSTTQPDLVQRFLLVHAGDRCDELRRAESERILRAQPYLVDARVTPYDDGRGGVVLEVETRDEFSAILELSARTRTPFVTDFRFGEANLAGAGLYTSAEWRYGGDGYRDGYSARITDYQFLRRPYQLTLVGAQKRIGDEWAADVTHPFYTDLQRVAWRVSAGNNSDYMEMLRPDADKNALFYRRGFASIGGVARIGAPGRLSLFGGSLSTERALTEDRVAVLTDSGLVQDVGPQLGYPLSSYYREQHVVRLNSLWGIRNVRFLGATGFDALTGRQDVRSGFQLGSVVGRGLGSLGSRDDDLFTSVDVYVGMGTSRVFLASEVQGEGRNDYDTGRWDGIIVTGRAAGYIVPDGRWRTLASAEFAGAWRPRIPVQLALGSHDGGVRGFAGSTAAGARRVVVRLEERAVVGSPFRVGDLGVATFVDAGRTFAGDSPYGTTTQLQAAAGVSLLGAFPPRSRRLWRLDLALPVTRSPGSKVEVILSSRDLTRTFWREPREVNRAREQAVPPTVFNWP